MPPTAAPTRRATGAPAPAAPVWWFVVAALPAALVAMVAGLALTGAAAPSTLFDPGPLVRWGLPAVTVLAHTATALTIGAFTLAATVLPARSPALGLLTRVGSGAAVAWALAQLGHLLLTHAAVLGTGLGGPGYGEQLAQFVTEVELGEILLWSVLLTAVVPLAAVATTGHLGAAVTTALALIAVVPTALTGHAAGAAAHELAVSSWWLHVTALGVWAGGLAALAVAARRLGEDLPSAAARFSVLAGWGVAVVALSGAANGWLRLDTPADLLTHPYGRLLLLKVVLTAALAVAGWAHRRVTLPALSRPDAGARRAFWRLAGGELVVMGAVVGVAVALGSSPPPVPQEPVPAASPVFILTGWPEPPYPTALTYLTQWRPDPLTALAGVAGIGVYLSWAARLRRRGDHWSAGRTVAWVAGLLLFLWVTNGGPAVYGSLLFSAHMIMHMLLAMVVPILLVLGAPVTLAVRAVPRRSDGSRGPREWLLALVHSRWAGFFSHPLVAAVNFAGSLVVFYYTPLFDLAVTSHVGHVLMVVHFTLAGYLFANALIGVDPGPRRPAYPFRLLLLLGTMAFHAFFGVSLMSLSSLLAADHFGRLGLSWWVDALADQEKGGAITWGIGEIPTITLAVVVALMWAGDDDRTARRSDRRADRDDDAELRAYNEMLAARAQSHSQT